jgi:hypothetical protein
MTHPDYATLTDWLEGRLDPGRAASVSAAVDGDLTLQQTVAWLRRFLETAKAVPMLAPPPVVHQRLMQHFHRWNSERASDELETLEFDAILLFDSREDLAPAGLRSIADVDAIVQLVFGCDAADIVIDVVPEPEGRVRLSGQVLADDGRAGGPYAVTAIGPDEQRIAIEGDELGRFSLGSVPATTSRLVLRNGQVTLRVSLDLGSGR